MLWYIIIMEAMEELETDLFTFNGYLHIHFQIKIYGNVKQYIGNVP